MANTPVKASKSAASSLMPGEPVECFPRSTIDHQPSGSRSISHVLAASGITIVPTRQRCQRDETHARGVIESIFEAEGSTHLRLVLDCVTVDPANRTALWSETIGAVSDAIQFHPTIVAEVLVSAFAAIDLRWHRERAVRLRPWPVRGTLRSFIDQDLDRLIKNHANPQLERKAHV